MRRPAYLVALILVGAAGCLYPGADVHYVQTPSEVVTEMLRLAICLASIKLGLTIYCRCRLHRRLDLGGASMNRITAAFLVVLAAPTAGAGSVLAAIYAQETLDRYLRIEYGVSPAQARTMISGYVYNQRAGYRAERMQLSIERLDAAGKVIGTSTAWVLGGVPPGSRAFFSARVEPAVSYRVQVLSFEWTQTQMGKRPGVNSLG